MDFFGGWDKGLEVDANDIVVTHRPGQPHEKTPDGKPAPVRQQRAVYGLDQLDMEFLHFKGAHGIGNEINLSDRAPSDEPEPVDKKPVLIGAKPGPVFRKWEEVIGRASGQNRRN